MTETALTPSPILLRAIGARTIETPHGTITSDQEVAFAVALYLIMERGRNLNRDIFCNMFWPEKKYGDRSRPTMRQLMHRLRKQYHFPIPERVGDIKLPQAFARVDYEELIAGDTSAVENKDIRFLGDYSPAISGEFADWLDITRSHMHRKAVLPILEAAKTSRDAGDWKRVDELVDHCLNLQPLNEEANCLRAESMAVSGDKKGSLVHLKRHAKKLGKDVAKSVPSHLLMSRIAESMPNKPYKVMRQAPLVGRKDSVRGLNAFIDRCLDHQGGVYFLWGEAGIGKSRLAEETERYAIVSGMTVRSVKCQPGDSQVPLSVFMNLLPKLQELRGSAGCSEEVKKNLDRITSYDQTLEQVQDAGGAEILRAQIRMAVMDLVDAIVGEQPILLVVEDIHWIDQASAKLLQDIGSWGTKQQLGVLLTSRKDYKTSTNLPITSALTCRRVTPLNENESRELALQIVDAYARKKLDETYLNRLVTIGDGKPFFLHELIKHWIDTGERHLTPPSVQAILQEQLDRLSAESLKVLQTVAMLGKHNTLERMSYILDYNDKDIIRTFEELGEAGMLEVRDKEVQSKHDLLTEEAINKLPTPAKQLLHRRIGGVLEREIEGRPSTSLLWDCAEHYKESGDVNKARWLTLSCARHLTELGYQEDAIEVYKRALTYSEQDQDRLKILSELAKAQMASTLWIDCVHTVETAQVLTTQLDSYASCHNDLEILELYSIWRAYRVNDNDLLQRIVQCIHDTTSTNAHKLEAACLGMKIGAILGDTESMKQIYLKTFPLLGDDSEDVITRLTLSLIYQCTCGDKDLAITIAESLVKVARGSIDSSRKLNALSHCALAFRRYGDVILAEKLLTEVLDICKQYQLQNILKYTAIQLIYLYLDNDKIELAKRIYSVIKDYEGNANPAEYTLIINIRDRISLQEAELLKTHPETSLDLMKRAKEQSTGSVKMETLALYVHSCLLKHEVPGDFAEIVNEMMRLHLNLRNTGGQDYETTILIKALHKVGRTDTADELLREYIEIHRSDRVPIPTSLNNYINPYTRSKITQEAVRQLMLE